MDLSILHLLDQLLLVPHDLLAELRIRAHAVAELLGKLTPSHGGTKFSLATPTYNDS